MSLPIIASTLRRGVAVPEFAAPQLLTPSQDTALQSILEASRRCGGEVALLAKCGFGRTAILRRLCESEPGAVLVDTRALMRGLMSPAALPIEESLLDLCLSALRRASSILAVDDLHLLMRVANDCSYPRANFLDIALRTLADEASAKGVTLVFGLEDEVPRALNIRAHRVTLERFKSADYRVILDAWLPDEARVDAEAVHRFAGKLTASHLVNACRWLGDSARRESATEAFLEHLRSQNLATNVDIQSVEQVTWSDLKGMDELVLELEAKIALPLENAAMADALQLRPKRGVLLAGPPGTGKTTIGKALAHRLKSKFFLLDGTVVAEGSDFYGTVEDLFEAARTNAPSILFIDDADVIFDGRSNRGFYRYLLTLLDGLQNTANQVCVMMTAMDPLALPPALLRSGRIELWLETRLPDEGARRDILAAQLQALPADVTAGVDPLCLARASRGFTGADLKSAFEDGKLLYAYDESCGAVRRRVESYFLDAIAKVQVKKRRGLRKQSVTEGGFGFRG